MSDSESSFEELDMSDTPQTPSPTPTPVHHPHKHLAMVVRPSGATEHPTEPTIFTDQHGNAVVRIIAPDSSAIVQQIKTQSDFIKQRESDTNHTLHRILDNTDRRLQPPVLTYSKIEPHLREILDKIQAHGVLLNQTRLANEAALSEVTNKVAAAMPNPALQATRALADTMANTTATTLGSAAGAAAGAYAGHVTTKLPGMAADIASTANNAAGAISNTLNVATKIKDALFGSPEERRFAHLTTELQELKATMESLASQDIDADAPTLHDLKQDLDEMMSQVIEINKAILDQHNSTDDLEFTEQQINALQKDINELGRMVQGSSWSAAKKQGMTHKNVKKLARAHKEHDEQERVLHGMTQAMVDGLSTTLEPLPHKVDKLQSDVSDISKISSIALPLQEMAVTNTNQLLNAAKPTHWHQDMKLSDLGQELKKKKAKAGQLTKFGDHSVHMAEVSSDLALIAQPQKTASATSTYVTHFWACAHKWADCVAGTNALGWRVSSYVNAVDRFGLPRPDMQFMDVALQFMTNPLEVHALVNAQVEWVAHCELGTFDDAALGSLKAADRIVDRTVVSVLNPILRIASQDALRNAIGVLTANYSYHDNYGMYAKLLHYALLRSLWSSTALAPTPVAYPAQAGYVTIVNLDDQNLSSAALTAPIISGNIVFLEGKDFDINSASEMQCLQILGAAGTRLTCANAATFGPSARFLSWPQIPITLLRHAAELDLPAAALVDPDVVINFAMRMAAARSEMGSLVKGLFTAMELLGIRYPDYTAGVVRTHVDHLFGSHPFRVNAPRDYNYLYRLLDIFPPVPANIASVRSELELFTSLSQQLRAKVSALYIALQSVCATTILAGVNITTTHLIDWFTTNPDHPLPGHLARFIDMMNEAPPVTTRRQEVVIESTFVNRVRSMAATTLNAQLPNNLFPTGSWLGQRASRNAQAANFNFSACLGLNRHAPRFLNPLCVGHLFESYPYEWGFAGWGSWFDLMKEVKRIATSANYMWVSYLGDSNYQQSAGKATPFYLQMYAYQVIQLYLSRAFPNVEPALLYYVLDHIIGNTSQEWGAPAAQQAMQPHWDNAHRMFVPCTFKSYDWGTSQIFVATFSDEYQDWVTYYGPQSTEPKCGWQRFRFANDVHHTASSGPFDFSILTDAIFGVTASTAQEEN